MLLKNVQDGISRPLGNQAIQKTKVETDLLDTLYKSLFVWVFLGRFWGVFGLFHGCFKGTSRLFREYFSVILEYIIGLPMAFLGCFYPIEFELVVALTCVHKSNKPF